MTLNEAFKALTPKQEKILRMRFGIGYDRCYTLHEIAAETGVSKQRIWLQEKKALEKAGAEYLKSILTQEKKP